MKNKIFKNKDVIQSYIITTAKYDYSVYEKRIIYRLVEMVQHTLEGKKLDKGFSIQKTLYNDRIITMPINAFLAGENDENYTRVKEALRKLRNKTFEYENGGKWKLVGVIEKPNFDISGVAQFELQPEVYDAILNFSKGYRKYELKVAMQFESVYAMRFYELMSGQKTPICYSIDQIKEMFQISDKYERVNDFKKKVLDTAKRELDRCSPYSFNYEMNKTGRKFTSITFYPKFQPKFRDQELEKGDLQKQISLSWDLPRELVSYLKNNFGFTTDGIKNNIDIFKEANESFDIVAILGGLKAKIIASNNPQGYIIGVIKKLITQ